jgi:hypothetical protein
LSQATRRAVGTRRSLPVQTERFSMFDVWPMRSNPAGASRLQSVRPVRRVAELGSLLGK